MPSRSKAQARTMQAVAHGWKPPKSSGIKIPVKVAKEFVKADAGITRGKAKAAPRMKGTGKGLMGR